MNLNEFAKEVHALAVEKGFYDPEPSDAELIAAIHSEISEAFEEWRANHPNVYHKCDIRCDTNDSVCDESCAHYESSECAESRRQTEPHGVAVELIDVVLRILDAAVAWGVAFHYYEPLVIERIEWNAYAKREIKSLSLPELVTYLHRTITDIDFDRANGNDISGAAGISYPISLAFAWLRAHDIDPEALMLEKHEYNKCRPYRHGGKRA